MTSRKHERKANSPRTNTCAQAAPSTKQASHDAEQRLTHELRVHQFELETQNIELRETRSRLETSLSEFIEFFENAPVPYVVLNSDGLINQVNRMGGRLIGVSTTGMVGGEFAKLIPSHHHHAFHAFWKEAWREPTAEDAPLTCEVPMITVHPRGRVIDVRMTAVMFAREGVGTLLVALEDITARKLYEHELQHSEQALLLADRNKNDFIAALSHELRNPLSPICSSLEILSKQQSMTGSGERALGVIRRQVDHMNYLVNELLDVSRISRAKMQLNIGRTSMTRIVKQTVDDHRALCQTHRIDLEVDAETGVWIDGDKARLVQIVSNLLTNAAKFTPVGGRIVATLKACDDSALLEVTDTGRGVDAEMIESVFEPFVQGGQSLERASGGLGLGLAMVKGLVELQGGQVTLHSAGLNCGTSVQVRLPLQSAPQSEAPRLRREAEKPCHLVVIDDNVDTADSLCDILRLRGHRAEPAYDGRSGLDMVRQSMPDAVICDIGLPVMDGYAVAENIRADAYVKHIHLIALTGYARADDIARAKNAGFDTHLSKPYNSDALTRTLDGLQQSRLVG